LRFLAILGSTYLFEWQGDSLNDALRLRGVGLPAHWPQPATLAVCFARLALCRERAEASLAKAIAQNAMAAGKTKDRRVVKDKSKLRLSWSDCIDGFLRGLLMQRG
jgi:hypothetical protein